MPKAPAALRGGKRGGGKLSGAGREHRPAPTGWHRTNEVVSVRYDQPSAEIGDGHQERDRQPPVAPRAQPSETVERERYLAASIFSHMAAASTEPVP